MAGSNYLTTLWCHIHEWAPMGGGKNQRSHLVGPPFPEFEDCFSAMAGWHFSRDLTRHLLIGGCGQGHISAKHG